MPFHVSIQINIVNEEEYINLPTAKTFKGLIPKI